MEESTRGTLEKAIDKSLEEPVLEDGRVVLKALGIKDECFEQAIFSYCMGRLIEFALDLIGMSKQREATDQEKNEVFLVIRNRIDQIKSRVREAANR